MSKTEAVLTLLHIGDEDLKKMDSPRLQDILGSLRCVTRQFEREIMQRETHPSEI